MENLKRTKPPKYRAESKYLKKCLALARHRKNILLVGPAGCGKTTLSSRIAEELALPFAFLSCSEGLTESHLLGKQTMKENSLEYAPSSFVDSYERGGVFLLDEIDAANANVLICINAALSSQTCAIPNRHESPIAKRHPDFCFIASANTFGNGADRQYVGRNQLDAATLDRFRIGLIYMDYDEGLEQRIIEKAILQWGNKIRQAIRTKGIRRIVSTRFLKDLTDMMFEPGFETAEDWIKILTQDWTLDEKSKVAEMARTSGGANGQQ